MPENISTQLLSKEEADAQLMAEYHHSLENAKSVQSMALEYWVTREPGLYHELSREIHELTLFFFRTVGSIPTAKSVYNILVSNLLSPKSIWTPSNISSILVKSDSLVKAFLKAIGLDECYKLTNVEKGSAVTHEIPQEVFGIIVNSLFSIELKEFFELNDGNDVQLDQIIEGCNEQEFFALGRKLLNMMVPNHFFSKGLRNPEVDLVHDSYNNRLSFAITDAIMQNFEVMLPHFQSESELESFLLMAKMYGFFDNNDPDTIKKRMLISWWLGKLTNSGVAIHGRDGAIGATRKNFVEKEFFNENSFALKQLKRLPGMLAAYKKAQQEKEAFSASSQKHLDSKASQAFSYQERNFQQSTSKAAELAQEGALVAAQTQRQRDFLTTVSSIDQAFFEVIDANTASATALSPDELQKKRREFVVSLKPWIKKYWRLVLEELTKANALNLPPEVFFSAVSAGFVDNSKASSLHALLNKDFNTQNPAPEYDLFLYGSDFLTYLLVCRAYFEFLQQPVDRPTKQRIEATWQLFKQKYEPYILKQHDTFRPPEKITDESVLIPASYDDQKYAEANSHFFDNNAALSKPQQSLVRRFDDPEVVLELANRKKELLERIDIFLNSFNVANLNEMAVKLAENPEDKAEHLNFDNPEKVWTWVLGLMVLIIAVIFVFNKEKFVYGPYSFLVFAFTVLLPVLMFGITKDLVAVSVAEEKQNRIKQLFDHRVLLGVKSSSGLLKDNNGASVYTGLAEHFYIGAIARLIEDNKLTYYSSFLLMLISVLLLSSSIAQDFSEANQAGILSSANSYDLGPQGGSSSPSSSETDNTPSFPKFNLNYLGDRRVFFAARELCWGYESATAQFHCGTPTELSFAAPLPDQAISYVGSPEAFEQAIASREMTENLLVQRKTVATNYFELIVGFEPVGIIVLNGTDVGAMVNPLAGITLSGVYEDVAIVYQPLAAEDMLPALDSSVMRPIPGGINDLELDFSAQELSSLQPLLNSVVEELRRQRLAVAQLTGPEIQTRLDQPASQRGWLSNAEILDLERDWFQQAGYEYGLEAFNGSWFSDGQSLLVGMLNATEWDCEMITRARYYVSREAAQQLEAEFGPHTFIIYELGGISLEAGHGQVGEYGHAVNVFLEVDGTLRVDGSTLPSENGVEFPRYQGEQPSIESKFVFGWAIRLGREGVTIISTKPELAAAVSGLLALVLLIRQRKRRQASERAALIPSVQRTAFGLPVTEEVRGLLTNLAGKEQLALISAEEINGGIQPDVIELHAESSEAKKAAPVLGDTNSSNGELNTSFSAASAESVESALEAKNQTAITGLADLGIDVETVVNHMINKDIGILWSNVLSMVKGVIELAGEQSIEQHVVQLYGSWDEYYRGFARDFSRLVERNAQKKVAGLESVNLNEQLDKETIFESIESIFTAEKPSRAAWQDKKILLLSGLGLTPETVGSLLPADNSRDEAILRGLKIVLQELHRQRESLQPSEITVSYAESLASMLPADELNMDDVGAMKEENQKDQEISEVKKAALALELQKRQGFEVQLQRYRATQAAIELIEILLTY